MEGRPLKTQCLKAWHLAKECMVFREYWIAPPRGQGEVSFVATVEVSRVLGSLGQRANKYL